MDTQNISVDKEIEFSGITELVPCDHCGNHYDTAKYSECPCVTEDREHKITQESAERIRYLISLGHPGEKGEPYSRWQTMDECRRRGKQLFIDLGWPTDPKSIYKNKYTGDEVTLRERLYKFCMDREQNMPFDERLCDYGWSILEHEWPKELWKDDQLNDEYKGKLSYFKDKTWSITETSADDDEEYNDNANDLMAEEDYEDEDLNEMTVTQHKKAVRRAALDKAQAGLGGWF